MAKSKKADTDFDSYLVLFRYFLNEIGVGKMSDLGRQLNNSDYEGFDSSGYSFYYAYIASLPHNKINAARLRQYDENITRHLRRIAERRGGIRLKYFQYVSLLFTEMFLDRYFSDRAEFLHSLNRWLSDVRTETKGNVCFKNYSEEELRKIAFMCATGSGKTLIMHINLLQYLHYFNKAKQNDRSLVLNKIILVTPNEAMSRQHLEEFDLSDIDAAIFSKEDTLQSVSSANESVLIIDINKLDSKMGDKKVAVESFETNNLVLVDEAHRGLTSGDAWVGYRKAISENGFTFEYSATFKQSLKAHARNKDEREAFEEYGKSIIIDYSYKYFYDDGYGKDFRIFNLESCYEGDSRYTYLIGCLLAFYQQIKFFDLNHATLKHYNIEKPLLVFVGSKVLATTGKAELSDVQEILVFIDTFVRQRGRSARLIEDILNGCSGIVDESGTDMFASGLTTLRAEILKYQNPDGNELYRDILRLVFNSSTTVVEPRLRIESLRNCPGEIALKVGKDDPYFGLISIGDTSGLIKICETKNLITDQDIHTPDSLFSSINNKESNINVLIGSRKFTEGWNSWRVSTMGLINFAKSEGSQAIQLFGRGVRLKGLDGCLKRSSAIEGRHLKNVDCLETLWVFGVKAQYMQVFRKLMENEGLDIINRPAVLKLPVLSRYKDVASHHNLNVIRLRHGKDFRSQARRMILDKPEKGFEDYLSKNVIVTDCRSRVQSLLSETDTDHETSSSSSESYVFPDDILTSFDYYRISDELVRYKSERKFYNITIVREKLKEILSTKGIYKLLIPEGYLNIRTFSQVYPLEEVATLVLKSYMERFYYYKKSQWEDRFLEYSGLKEDDKNFPHEYKIEYSPSEIGVKRSESLQDFIDHVSTLISGHTDLKYDQECLESDEKWPDDSSLCLFDFGKSLYAPLLSLTNNKYRLKVSPVGLNDGEKKFVFALKRYVREYGNSMAGKNLYLMRNKSKSGIGFIEASNFYPDFILWIDMPDKQYITFVDPKGLRIVSPNDPKIRLHEEIKIKEKQLQPYNGKCIILNSFILSVTESSILEKCWDMSLSQIIDMNVIPLDKSDCIEKMMAKILSE